MQYNEIYNICQPVIDWLKEQYPNNHKIVIDTTGADLIECGKLIALDKDLKSITSQNPYITKECGKQVQDILNMDISEIKDGCHRFGIEMLQKLFNYENQPEPKKKDREASDND